MANPPDVFPYGRGAFPMAVDPDPEVLSKIAGGVIWVAALLATLLSLDALYKADVETAALDSGWLSGAGLCTL